HLVLAGFVVGEGLGDNEQMVNVGGQEGRLVGEVVENGAEGDKNLVHVPAVVAGVLVLGRHDSDDGVGNVVEDDRLADGRAAGKELLLDVAPKESHAAARLLVAPVVEPSRLHADGANLGEGRIG